MCAVSFCRQRVLAEVFFQDVLRKSVYVVFASSLQAKGRTYHIISDGFLDGFCQRWLALEDGRLRRKPAGNLRGRASLANCGALWKLRKAWWRWREVKQNEHESAKACEEKEGES